MKESNIFKKTAEGVKALKKRLPAEDILTYAFTSADGSSCAVLYADGMINKQLLGELVIHPLERLNLPPVGQKERKDVLLSALYFPEIKESKEEKDAAMQILDGNALLLVDGLGVGLVVGSKLLPVRAVTEPPTDVAVKGPREGFIEDIKTNMALIRKRLKTPDLRLETTRVGKRSGTAVCLCYLEGIVTPGVKEEVEKLLKETEIDCVPDSSYITELIAPRKHSLFRSVGTTERPDVLACKLAEGRLGILVDGSPIALTLPFAAVEDFQTAEDYYTSQFLASLNRTLRIISAFIALLLPAFYLSSQLFKLQLLPLGLTLTIVEGTGRLPFSPSMETFAVLFVFEVLKEASIRMPKYVGMSLSVVGALVLGEAAVSAGFLSTPTIIVVACSGICLYAVPNFVETGSMLRWIFLLIGGSVGPFGMTLLAAFTLYYLISSDRFGMPPLAPFSPLTPADLKDGVIKYDAYSLKKRPRILKSKNKTRLKYENERNG